MRISFIYWNVKRHPLQAQVSRLALEHHANVVMLAECAIPPPLMLETFRAMNLPTFTYPYSPLGYTGDIRIFAHGDFIVKQVYDDPNNHVTIRRLIIPHIPDILLVVVHSQSKREWKDADQAQIVGRLSRKIREKENEASHQRTILVGDLNMNPFEDGIVGSEGLHAVMTKQIAANGTRLVDAESRPFFFNPMWRFFGDRPDGPPGTFYLPPSGKPIAFFWNMYDQVMLRPSLMHNLRDVRILDSVGGESLLDRDGRPDSEIASDHLPLLFTLCFD